MKSRGINLSECCPHCQAEESGLHLFFQCPFAINIWEMALFKSQLNPVRISSLRMGIELSNRLVNLPPLGVGTEPLVPWILWNIWTCRNKKIFETAHLLPADVLSNAIRQAREWIGAQSTNPTQTQGRSLPPMDTTDAGTIRCFSDAAWRDPGEAGFGWVFFNHLVNSEHHDSSSATRAIALSLAQKQALDLGYRKVSFASDSQLVIKALNLESSSKELYGILQDILYFSSQFDECSFSYVPRGKNTRADALAKSALMSAFIVRASGLV